MLTALHWPELTELGLTGLAPLLTHLKGPADSMSWVYPGAMHIDDCSNAILVEPPNVAVELGVAKECSSSDFFQKAEERNLFQKQSQFYRLDRRTKDRIKFISSRKVTPLVNMPFPKHHISHAPLLVTMPGARLCY